MHPLKPLTPIASIEDSSSSRLVTSKRMSVSKHRLIGSKCQLEDSLSCTRRMSVFERLGVKGMKKKKLAHLLEPLSLVESMEDFSSSRSITSKRVNVSKQKPTGTQRWLEETCLALNAHRFSSV